MLCCQFLCHVLIALFFIKIALKLNYICKKMQIFERCGCGAPKLPASGSWGLVPGPQLASGGWGRSPQTPKTAPPLRISGYAPGCAFERRSSLKFREKSATVLVKTFFWSSPKLAEKSVPFLARTFFLVFT